MSGMAALRGATIAGEVYAWIIVFVLPVNSAINPILYTLAAQNPIKVTLWLAEFKISEFRQLIFS